MFLSIQRKGKKLLLREAELHQYMDKKIKELSSLASSVILALVMITMLTILTVFKAGYIYLYALILLPLIGRVYVFNVISRWLRKKFQELIGVNPEF